MQFSVKQILFSRLFSNINVFNTTFEGYKDKLNSQSGAIQEFKRGKLEYRVDKTGIVHINFGKVDFPVTQLQENFSTVFKSIMQNKPTGVKGKYLKKLYICSTMGPSIELDYSVL